MPSKLAAPKLAASTLALLPLLVACSHLRVEPKGALDGFEGDLLVLIDGFETIGPPSLMVNSKKAAAAFERTATTEHACAQLVASLGAAERIGRVECQALAGSPLAFVPVPGMQFRLGTFDVPIPAAGAKLVQGDFAPQWALILDSLYVGYEQRSAGNNGSYPVIEASARVVWWSNTEGRALAWGQDRGVVRTAGWLAPENVGTSVSESLDLLAFHVLRHAGIE
ncbi:MAG: hypothetical protein Q8P41_19050 [Pseudomonadota bacterium]|nr:hypothetical protein [Pseudomonadota bacterium]